MCKNLFFSESYASNFKEKLQQKLGKVTCPYINLCLQFYIDRLIK